MIVGCSFLVQQNIEHNPVRNPIFSSRSRMLLPSSRSVFNLPWRSSLISGGIFFKFSTPHRPFPESHPAPFIVKRRAAGRAGGSFVSFPLSLSPPRRGAHTHLTPDQFLITHSCFLDRDSVTFANPLLPPPSAQRPSAATPARGACGNSSANSPALTIMSASGVAKWCQCTGMKVIEIFYTMEGVQCGRG